MLQISLTKDPISVSAISDDFPLHRWFDNFRLGLVMYLELGSDDQGAIRISFK